MKLSPQTIAANIAAAAAEQEEQAAAAAAGNSNSTSTTTTTSNNNNNNSGSHRETVSAMVSTASTGSAAGGGGAGGGAISTAIGHNSTSSGSSSGIAGSGTMNPNQQLQQPPNQQSQQAGGQAGQSQQQQQQVPPNPPGKSTPKDTQVVAAILKEMGITEYEPRVLPQLVEFAYRYASRVLEDAQLFSSYAKKKSIDGDDVGIAVQMQMERSFVGPPPRDELLEIARSKNNQQLPPIKSHNGMRLPADRYSLVAANLRLVSNSSSSSGAQANKGQMMTSAGAAKPRPVSNASMLNKSVFPMKSGASSMMPGSQQSSTASASNADMMGVKRRLDET